MRKKLLRLLWVAPVAMLLFADAASAQSTGTIVGVVNDAATGKPVAGALVIATSKALQGEQTAVTDARGQFTITALPPGDYKLSAQLQGFKPAERTDITLRVDFTLRANLAMVPESVQMEEQVVRTGVAPAVNIGSAEAGTIVSREFLASRPAAEPLVRAGRHSSPPPPRATRYGISFAGASSPENNYIIDGLRVSDPSYGTLGTNLLTNFVDQLDVKVGSFMPEYGYSLGRHREHRHQVGRQRVPRLDLGQPDPRASSPRRYPGHRRRTARRSPPSAPPTRAPTTSDFGVELGGPIVKDKLWFYAGFAPQMNYKTVPGVLPEPHPLHDPAPNSRRHRSHAANGLAIGRPDRHVPDEARSPAPSRPSATATPGTSAIAKLTWLINENNNVFVSFNTQPTKTFGRTSLQRGRLRGVASNTNVEHHQRHPELHGQVPRQAPAPRGHRRLVQLGLRDPECPVTNGGVDTLTPTRSSWRTHRSRFRTSSPGITCPTGGRATSRTTRTGGCGLRREPDQQPVRRHRLAHRTLRPRSASTS